MTKIDLFYLTDDFADDFVDHGADDYDEQVEKFINEAANWNDDFKERVEYAANMGARQLVVWNKVFEDEPVQLWQAKDDPRLIDHDEWVYFGQELKYFKIDDDAKIIGYSFKEPKDFTALVERKLKRSVDQLMEVKDYELIDTWYLVTELKTGIQEADWTLRFA